MAQEEVKRLGELKVTEEEDLPAKVRADSVFRTKIYTDIFFLACFFMVMVSPVRQDTGGSVSSIKKDLL